MKFIHIADLHIGKYLNQKSLIEDQKFILNQIIDKMKEHHVTTLLISGDIYDRQIPSREAVALFNDFLKEAIINNKFKIYIISGNHDSIERLDFASTLLKSEGLYIDSIIKSPLNKYQIEDEYGEVNIYMMPFCTPLYARVNMGINVSTFADMIKYFIESSDIDFSKRNVLLTHHTVLHHNTAITSDSETNVLIGGSEGIEGSYFKEFDYVALGHLHNPQYITKKHIRYSGSILKYSESESNFEKSCVLVDILDKGNTNITLLPLTPLHNLKQKVGSLSELLNNPLEQDLDYIYFTLTDELIIPNAMSRLKVKYPNAISLNYKQLINIDTNKNIKISSNFHQLSYTEQFMEFFKTVTNKELTKSQQELFDDIIKKGLNKDETN